MLNDFPSFAVWALNFNPTNQLTKLTLINEEALLLAKYLRNEKRDWIPQVGIVG
jgi:hypothetical protein